jgi:hypothetical protein
MPLPLQDTAGDQAAGEVMPLSPFRAGWTATQAELNLADADHCFDVIVATHNMIDLVFQTQVYKLKRARQTRSRA